MWNLVLLQLISFKCSHSACPKWTFGPGCSEECQCLQQNTLECHRRHGTCVCKPGYQGNTCKEGEHLPCIYCRLFSTLSLLCYTSTSCFVLLRLQNATQVLSEPAVRRSAPARQECRVIMWLGSASESAHLVVMGRTVIKVHGWMEELLSIYFSFVLPVLRQVPPVCPVSDCPEGRFGTGCVHPCNCTGAPCNKVTGQCKCPPGTSGEHCENCEWKQIFLQFSTKCLHDKILINYQSFTVCPEGFWGPGCTETCPSCENGGVCDKHNGSCNCPPGFMGRICQNCEYQ